MNTRPKPGSANRSRTLLFVVALLAGCEAAPAVPSDLRVATQNLTGNLVLVTSGDVLFGSVLLSCYEDTKLFITNVGTRSSRFRLSAPSDSFRYDVGPYVIEPSAILEVPLRLDARNHGGLSGLSHPLEIQPEGESSRSFTLRSSVLVSDVSTPSFDFGAVELGDERALEFDPGRAAFGPPSGDFFVDAGIAVFRPTSLGPRFGVGDWTYDERCLPLPARYRGDGVTSIVVGPSSIDLGEVTAGMEVTRELGVETLTNDLPTIEVLEPSSVFRVLAGPTRSVTWFRNLDGGIDAAHHFVTVRFTLPTVGPRAAVVRVSVRRSAVDIPLRVVGVD